MGRLRFRSMLAWNFNAENLYTVHMLVQLCGTCPETNVPTGAPTGTPTISEPTASPTQETCYGVGDYEFCWVLDRRWCEVDFQAQLACPIRCRACTETKSPNVSPTVSPSMDAATSCNGIRDPGFCTSPQIASCDVGGIPPHCPGRCDVCPPTAEPTMGPTSVPTRVPTLSPVTPEPTPTPTNFPTAKPSTLEPSRAPTTPPSTVPTTGLPTTLPTPLPTPSPTPAPSPAPTGTPSAVPTGVPTGLPSTSAPTGAPSMAPTYYPTPYRTCVNDETTPHFRGVVRKCECVAHCHTCEHDGINAGRCLNVRSFSHPWPRQRRECLGPERHVVHVDAGSVTTVIVVLYTVDWN